MGVVQSSVNSEVLIAGAAVAVGSLTTIGLYARSAKKQDAQKLHTSVDSPTTDAASPSLAPAVSGEKKGKGKKKKGKDQKDADAEEFDRILATARESNAKSTASVGVVSVPQVAVAAVPGAFDQSSAADDSEALAPKGKKAKRKKGKKGASPAPPGGEGSRTLAASMVTSPDSSIIHVPSDTPAEPERPAPPSKKERKKRAARAVDTAQTQSTPKAAQASAPASSSGADAGPSVSTSATDDASWTRVEARKRSADPISSHGKHPSTTDAELLTSDTNLTTSVTGETESEEGANTEDELEEATQHQSSGNRKTFAEKMLGKPRKTGVEDMEEVPLQPTLARVIRSVPASEKPAKGFSWGDYEEYAHTGDEGTSADGDEDVTWEEVKGRKRGKADRSASSSGSVPKASLTAPETITKRQRQNLLRRDAAKAEKAAADAEREMRLAQHRRELERVRIAEQYSSGGGKGKKVSGGMTASVESGKLVWE